MGKKSSKKNSIDKIRAIVSPFLPIIGDEKEHSLRMAKTHKLLSSQPDINSFFDELLIYTSNKYPEDTLGLVYLGLMSFIEDEWDAI